MAKRCYRVNVEVGVRYRIWMNRPNRDVKFVPSNFISDRFPHAQDLAIKYNGLPVSDGDEGDDDHKLKDQKNWKWTVLRESSDDDGPPTQYYISTGKECDLKTHRNTDCEENRLNEEKEDAK